MPKIASQHAASARDHVRVDGSSALLEQIIAELTGQEPATGVLARVGDRLARGTATLDLTAARQASVSSGRTVVIAHRPGGPALGVRWFAPRGADHDPRPRHLGRRGDRRGPSGL